MAVAYHRVAGDKQFGVLEHFDGVEGVVGTPDGVEDGVDFGIAAVKAVECDQLDRVLIVGERTLDITVVVRAVVVAPDGVVVPIGEEAVEHPVAAYAAYGAVGESDNFGLADFAGRKVDSGLGPTEGAHLVDGVGEAGVVVAVEGADLDGVEADGVVLVGGDAASYGFDEGGVGVGAGVEPPLGVGGVAAVGDVGHIASVGEGNLALAVLKGVDRDGGLGVVDADVDVGGEGFGGVHGGGHVAAEDHVVGEVVDRVARGDPLGDQEVAEAAVVDAVARAVGEGGPGV